MFTSQSNHSFREENLFKKQHYNSYQKKNIQFHQNIRKKQIEQKMKCMREQILASLSEDYYVLKGINLNDTLCKLSEIREQNVQQNWQDMDRIIKDVFIYSRSDQSDHLYYLIDDKIIVKLTNMLQINNICVFERNPRTYIRVLWIIANYTTYASQSIENYHQLLYSIELCKQIFFTLFLQLTNIPTFYQSQKQYKIFTHVQAKQILYLILFSINNLSVNTDILLSICFKPNKQTSFLNELIKEYNRLAVFAKHNDIKDTLVSDMLSSLINIFQSILKLNIVNSQMMQVIYQIDFQIVNMLLQTLTTIFAQQKQRSIQLQIIVALRYFLDNHLQTKPELILYHNFNILFQMFTSISQQLISINNNIIDYHNQLEIQGVIKESLYSLQNKSASLQKRLNQLLQILIIIFRLNIPEEDNEKMYDAYQGWLDCVLPIFQRFFSKVDNNLDEIRYKILIIISDVCLEQEFIDLILDQLGILSRVFYYIKSQSVQVRLKKAALNVLTSIICISLDGYSESRIHVIEMLKNNKILQIFSNNIGEFVDEELNTNLVRSLLLYLRTETTEDPEDHVIWAQFCHQGGNKKLAKYHSVIKNIQIRQAIEAILFEFKSF